MTGNTASKDSGKHSAWQKISGRSEFGVGLGTDHSVCSHVFCQPGVFHNDKHYECADPDLALRDYRGRYGSRDCHDRYRSVCGICGGAVRYDCSLSDDECRDALACRAADRVAGRSRDRSGQRPAGHKDEASGIHRYAGHGKDLIRLHHAAYQRTAHQL